MKTTRVKLFDRLLAPYATKHSESKGRRYHEEISSTRLPFERDRDRIIHSNAFRRLKGKTQVLVAGTGDHFRTRLTHTLEVAQVSRSLARALHLNEDLAEAIALAHDLGHTPFAHGGEEAMHRMLKRYGLRFEHNEQSRRVVELLEERYPDFPGLNLTFETLDGLGKHETPWDHPKKKAGARGLSLEGQVVDLGDEIAYTAHDIDDGLRARFFTIRDLARCRLIQRMINEITQDYGMLDERLLRYQIVRYTIGFLVHAIIEETKVRLEKHRVTTRAHVLRCSSPIVAFPKRLEQARRELRQFLTRRFYFQKKIVAAKKEGQRIIEVLFRHCIKNPTILPSSFAQRINNPDPLPIVVKDYIAGMTDNFAREEYQNI